MTDTIYTGIEDDRRYRGEHADVTFNVKRCIHAQECVKGLKTVFNRNARPWIFPDGAPVDELQEVILRCPSGALHIIRKDEGEGEALPAQNTVILWDDGPLQVRGKLTIQATHVNMQNETRATLCRCGGSQNKPFCDNAHRENGFTAASPAPLEPHELSHPEVPLSIQVEPNGPYVFEGPVEVRNQAGDVIFRGENTCFCRCGHSHTKPFCDGTHDKIHFQAE